MATMQTAQARRAHRSGRDEALRRRFQQLYNKDRLRLDDVLRRLAAEYFLSERTVARILKHSPPASAAARVAGPAAD